MKNTTYTYQELAYDIREEYYRCYKEVLNISPHTRIRVTIRDCGLGYTNRYVRDKGYERIRLMLTNLTTYIKVAGLNPEAIIPKRKSFQNPWKFEENRQMISYDNWGCGWPDVEILLKCIRKAWDR